MNTKQNYSQENEIALLGSILIDNTVLKNIQKILSPDNFYYDKYKKIYQAMIELNNSSVPIDTVTLTKYLTDTGIVDEVGGAYEIIGLRDSCPSAANAIVYADSVRKNAIERTKKKIGNRISQGDEKADTELIELLKSTPDSQEFSQSDAGNAELFVKLNGDKIRYNHTEKIWLIWNGNYWQPDKKNEINELAKQSAKHRQHQAISISDSTMKKREMDFAIKSEDHYRIIACINSAKTLSDIATTAGDWNQDQLSLQCENGTLLLNGKVNFVPGKPKFMISKSIRIIYDNKEKCPIWEKAILEIFSNDVSMVEYFQRCVGYTLTGLTNEQKFFLLHGNGANGKSVIFEILKDLLGDYAINTRFATFEQKFNKRSNEIARLHQSRLVTASESGNAKKLDSELLKEVTGGDRVTGRFLYNESFDFSPQFKLWLASNTLPEVNDISLGFWRRMQIIKLNEKFVDGTADSDLVNKLKNELPGILNWAIEGFEQYADIRLDPPKKIENAIDEYRSDSNIVMKFVVEFIVTSKGNIITAKKMYKYFLDWHIKNYSDMPISQIIFGKRMREQGYTDVKIGGVKKWIDVIIND
jgi:putative DNA primase/helicase